jgi:hypothetical protein
MEPTLRRPKASPVLSDSLHRRLNAYALAASAAGVGALALVPKVEGKVIYTPVHLTVVPGQPVTIALPGEFNLNQYSRSGGHTLSVCQYMGEGICNFSAGTNAVKTTNADGGRQYAAAMHAGVSIRPGQRFRDKRVVLGVADGQSSGSARWVGEWFNEGDGVKDRYLGLRFKINGKMHFGWARITVDAMNGHWFTATLTGYAYETIPNKPIIAGDKKGTDEATFLPQTETSSLGTLARGRR